MELKPNMTVSEAIGYLSMLAGTINNDIVPLLDTVGSAPFAIAREVFSYVDHLASLRYGRSNSHGMSDNAKKFLKEYLRQVDPAYRLWGSALYEMYRHGTVHNFAPQNLTNGAETLVWQMYAGPRQGAITWAGTTCTENVVHLAPILRQPGLLHLPVSTKCLIDDLKQAIVLFENDLNRDANLMTLWDRHASFVSKPKNMTPDWKRSARGQAHRPL